MSKEKTQAWTQLDSDKICFTFKTYCNVFYIPKYDYKCDFVSEVLNLLNHASGKKYYLTYFAQDSRIFSINSEVMNKSFDFIVPPCDKNAIEKLLSILNGVHDFEIEFEAKSKLMSWPEACKEMSFGKKVRRQSWANKGCHISTKKMILNLDGVDLRANDWVICE